MVFQGQAQVGIGEWDSHLPYQAGRLITQSDTKIIYATNWSLLIIDKEDFSHSFLSKVEGLSDIGISEIKYDLITDQLIVAYTNSNIDIIKDDDVVNLPNIKSNLSISGDKMIYDIHVDNGIAYFSTGFGLVELDLSSYDFGFTVFTGIKVNDSSTKDQKIFIATDDGIYSGKRDPQINLGDFNKWKLLDEAYGFPSVYGAKSILHYNNNMYTVIDRQLWKETDQLAVPIYELEENEFDIEFVASSDNNLMLALKDNLFSSKVLFFSQEGTFTESMRLCTDRITGVLEDDQGRIWYADEWNQIRYSNNKNEECKRLEFNSPFSHKTSSIDVKDGIVYVASGGVSENFGVLSAREGFYRYDGREWSNINESNLGGIKENDLINFFKIKAHPSNEKLYVGTYWGGILELDQATNELNVYSKENSSLQGTIGDEQRERISGLTFDRNENLWISNMWAPKPLSVFTPEGTWHSFDIKISDKALTEIAIDDNGYKWITVFGSQGGVVVFSEGENVADLSDDQQVFLNKSNTELATNLINDVAVDLEGSVWVGTSEGLVVFECGSEIFDEECGGRTIKVQQDSIGALLLADVEIKTIAIDGANRKWFGSRNGIFVQSPDGITEELRFTESNSPLFDDNIIDLSYDGVSGQMYIATDKGLQSYRTDNSDGSRFHRASEVFAFPNPVRPDYNGPIAIEGLAADADIKITDVNGRLVYEGEANGGTAIWDGRDLSQAKVATGVYLVFSTSTQSFDNPDSFVTKILFVN